MSRWLAPAASQIPMESWAALQTSSHRHRMTPSGSGSRRARLNRRAESGDAEEWLQVVNSNITAVHRKRKPQPRTSQRAYLGDLAEGRDGRLSTWLPSGPYDVAILGDQARMVMPLTVPRSRIPNPILPSLRMQWQYSQQDLADRLTEEAASARRRPRSGTHQHRHSSPAGHRADKPAPRIRIPNRCVQNLSTVVDVRVPDVRVPQHLHDESGQGRRGRRHAHRPVLSSGVQWADPGDQRLVAVGRPQPAVFIGRTVVPLSHIPAEARPWRRTRPPARDKQMPGDRRDHRAPPRHRMSDPAG